MILAQAPTLALALAQALTLELALALAQALTLALAVALTLALAVALTLETIHGTEKAANMSSTKLTTLESENGARMDACLLVEKLSAHTRLREELRRPIVKTRTGKPVNFSAIQSTQSLLSLVKRGVTITVVHSVAYSEIMEWVRCSATGTVRMAPIWEDVLKNGKGQVGMV